MIGRNDGCPGLATCRFPAQYLTYLDPLRYFMEIVRSIFLKGVGIEVLWPQVLALFLFGITILGLSALRFHKRLD